MAQFECPVCGEGFEQKSALEHHMETSHPARAMSAADLTRRLKGIHFPVSRDDLVKHVKHRDGGVGEAAAKLPDREYRDAADVARAFGELKSHQPKPHDQPSKSGGQTAKRRVTPVHIAALFKGADFPMSGGELKAFVRDRHPDEETLSVIERFSDRRTYRNMADVEREVGQHLNP